MTSPRPSSSRAKASFRFSSIAKAASKPWKSLNPSKRTQPPMPTATATNATPLSKVPIKDKEYEILFKFLKERRRAPHESNKLLFERASRRLDQDSNGEFLRTGEDLEKYWMGKGKKRSKYQWPMEEESSDNIIEESVLTQLGHGDHNHSTSAGQRIPIKPSTATPPERHHIPTEQKALPKTPSRNPSAQSTSHFTRWTPQEKDQLHQLIKETQANEQAAGRTRTSEVVFWQHIDSQMKVAGYTNRSFRECSDWWNKFGRSEFDYDERPHFHELGTAAKRTPLRVFSGPAPPKDRYVSSERPKAVDGTFTPGSISRKSHAKGVSIGTTPSRKLRALTLDSPFPSPSASPSISRSLQLRKRHAAQIAPIRPRKRRHTPQRISGTFPVFVPSPKWDHPAKVYTESKKLEAFAKLGVPPPVPKDQGEEEEQEEISVPTSSKQSNSPSSESDIQTSQTSNNEIVSEETLIPISSDHTDSTDIKFCIPPNYPPSTPPPQNALVRSPSDSPDRTMIKRTSRRTSTPSLSHLQTARMLCYVRVRLSDLNNQNSAGSNSDISDDDTLKASTENPETPKQSPSPSPDDNTQAHTEIPSTPSPPPTPILSPSANPKSPAPRLEIPETPSPEPRPRLQTPAYESTWKQQTETNYHGLDTSALPDPFVDRGYVESPVGMSDTELEAAEAEIKEHFESLHEAVHDDLGTNFASFDDNDIVPAPVHYQYQGTQASTSASASTPAPVQGQMPYRWLADEECWRRSSMADEVHVFDRQLTQLLRQIRALQKEYATLEMRRFMLDREILRQISSGELVLGRFE